VLTRNSAAAAPDLGGRLSILTGAVGRALVALRVDSSPVASNSGYRIFTAGATLDPLSKQYGGGQSPVSLPSEMAYLPYQELSVELARMVDTELARAGLTGAPDRLRQAPFYLLRRADMPAVCLTLGYGSNDRDRSRMNDAAFVESAARAVAQALLDLDRRLQETAGGTNR